MLDIDLAIVAEPTGQWQQPYTYEYAHSNTALIPVLQRQVRTLSVSLIIVKFFSQFMGVSQPALDIMGRDPIEDYGFVRQITLETIKGLAPGPNLDDLNAKAVNILNASLKHAPAKVKMFGWVSHEIMMATTNAVYGSRNPFNAPAVRAAYYKLEGSLLTLVTGFLPSLFAKEALTARRVITEAFLKSMPKTALKKEHQSTRETDTSILFRLVFLWKMSPGWKPEAPSV
ncbi:hypothetical protein PG993_010861 [Apiospora rasikravindrae]|uniref:Uncharacterized protein n=1 Tax=Apiospora rasikravindrae TaxID=990691 RepID=A0ABR1SCH9_9PEZI